MDVPKEYEDDPDFYWAVQASLGVSIININFEFRCLKKLLIQNIIILILILLIRMELTISK